MPDTDELSEFYKWKAEQAQQQQADDATFNKSKPEEVVTVILEQEKTKFQNNQPMQVPREYMYVAIASAGVITLLTWPILILGVILGGYAMLKIGCPLSGGK